MWYNVCVQWLSRMLIFIYLWQNETAVNLSEEHFVLAPQVFMMGSHTEQHCEALNLEKTSMKLM